MTSGVFGPRRAVAVLVLAGFVGVSSGCESAETAVSVPTTEVLSSASEPIVTSTPSPVLPAAMAGLPLADWVGGDAARTQVEQLHGIALGEGMDEAWVARYGAGEAVLWVTRAARPAEARGLYERMVDEIAVGDSPFTAQQPITVSGVEGYSLDGLGQRHYYFIFEGDLYWLAIDAEFATAGFEGLVAQAHEAAGVE